MISDIDTTATAVLALLVTKHIMDKRKAICEGILHLKHGVDMESIICLTGINRINIVHIYGLQKPWQKQCSFIDI